MMCFNDNDWCSCFKTNSAFDSNNGIANMNISAYSVWLG